MACDYGNRMFDGTPKTSTTTAVTEAATATDDGGNSKTGVQQMQISSETIITETVMQSSEEVNQINSALAQCTQLRLQLRGTLLYIQRLNSKYAHTDYMAVVRNLDNYRRCQSSSLSSSVTNVSAAASPYPKVRSRQCSRSVDETNETVKNVSNGGTNIISSTPVKRISKMVARRRCLAGRRRNDVEEDAGINNATFTSTPKQTKFAQLAAAFEFGHSDIDTPKRTVREMANKSNTISVCKIKVQRDIEAIITHLQVMQKQQLKRQQQQFEQSLYQSCSSQFSPFGTPISSATPSAVTSPRFAGRRFMEHSNANSSYGTAYDSNHSMNFYTPAVAAVSASSPSKFNRSSAESMQFDEGKRTLERVERCYVTPLQRMHKRLIHLNASLVRTC